MPDPIKLITRRITAMTYQAIDAKAQFIWGRVLSRNADGTLNVDDGRGGCVLIVPPTNVRTGDRIFVNLGAAIEGIGMPGVASYSAAVPQVNHIRQAVFVDNAGNVYNATTGTLVSTGGTVTAGVDASFGYADQPPDTSYLVWAGTAPDYHNARIGNDTITTGYQGESYSANNTVLCRGVGAALNLLLGIEIDNTTAPDYDVWSVNIRNVSDFDIVATNAATYISDWMTAHPTDFPGVNTSWDVHVSPDPSDGSFWINLGGNTGTATAPVFNVDPSDGSLISTVVLDTSGYSGFRRAQRVMQ